MSGGEYLTQVENSLFNPDSENWRGVSPRLAPVRVALATIFGGVLTAGALVTMALTNRGWLGAVAAGIAAISLLSAVLARRQVRAIGYLERADDILIRKGILFRDMKVVPYGRIQYLDVTAGPLARRFNLAKLELNTAAQTLNADLPGLDPAEAARLRDRLAQLSDAKMAGL